MNGLQLSLALLAVVLVALTTAQNPIMPFGQGPPGMPNDPYSFFFNPFNPPAAFAVMHPFATLNPYAHLNPFAPAAPWSQQRMAAANTLGASQQPAQLGPNLFSSLGSFARLLEMIDLV